MQLWTPAHVRTLLPAVIIMVIAAVALRYLLAGKSDKVRRIPLQIVAVCILLLEIAKQTISMVRGYDLYHISLLILMLPLMAFYNGKHRQNVRAIGSVYAMSVFLLTVIYPDLIYSAYNIEHFFDDFFSFHTVAFHNIALFAYLLILMLELYTPGSAAEQKPVTLATLTYCVIGATAAQLLKTNFNNFYQCNIAPLEQVRQSLQGVLGAGLTQVLYVLIVITLDLAFVIGCYWLHRLLSRCVSKLLPLRTKVTN